MSVTNDLKTVNEIDSEAVTPHRLTVAILIRDYCQFRDQDTFNNLDGMTKAKLRRDFCVLVLKLLQSPDLTLKLLRNILLSTKYQINSNLIDLFSDSLYTIYYSGTGALLDFIDSLNRVMTISYDNNGVIDNSFIVSKSSIVGYFLRRLIVNFDELSFSEVTNVLIAFRDYYEEWEKDEKSSTSEVDDNDWSASKNLWSRRQAELFIATQAALLTHNQEKALTPLELQNRINNLLHFNPSLAEAHFLSYLNYLRVKEFCGAIDSLYHCFDRSTLDRSNNEDKNKVFRFAALNLGILQYNFGHKEEALAALKEAIRISQSANDNICLQHALCWLYRLTPINKDKLIEHSVSKSFELNLSYTASLGIQTFVQYASLISGHPHQIFETLTKGDLINCQNNLKDLISNSYAVKAALWQFYGKPEMSLLSSQLLLYLNIDNCHESKAVYGEGFCLAVCNVANYFIAQGNYNLVGAILGFAKQQFPNEPFNHIWMFTENLFIFLRELYHENWEVAEKAAQQILVFDKWEGYLRLAELYYYKEDFQQSHQLVNIILSRYQESDKNKLKIFYYIRANILLAEIQFTTSCVPAGIITLLNNCQIEANKYNLDYYSALMHLHVAFIQLDLGLVDQAICLLDRCLVQVLAHGGRYDRGRAMLLYVKCKVAQSAELMIEKRKKVIREAADMLDRVKEDFKAVEAFSRVKDILFLQAQLYNNADLRQERNKCSLEFRLLDEEHETKNFSTLGKYL